ncbi:MAG: hypothetical protein U0736_05475 [Gemmataceae bacterium]
MYPGDILLTTSVKEVKAIGATYPGKFEGGRGHYAGVMGFGFPEQQPGTALIRRYRNSATGKHKFSIQPLPTRDWKAEGPVAWVYTTRQPSTVPLYRLLPPTDTGDEFLTATDQVNTYTKQMRYKYGGNLGYLLSRSKAANP